MSGYRMAAKDDKAEILIYEEIGEGWFGGISAKQFAKDLKALGKVKNINMRINSPGGDVFEATTMYNLLRDHNAEVETTVDGLAASAASVLMLAGDTRRVAANAIVMIHDPWWMAVGTSEEMRKAADTLDTIKESIVGTYANRTGGDEDEIVSMMAEETWMDADQALETGFATEIIEDMKVAAHIDRAKFAHYRNVPKSLLESPKQQNERRQAELLQRAAEFRERVADLQAS